MTMFDEIPETLAASYSAETEKIMCPKFIFFNSRNLSFVISRGSLFEANCSKMPPAKRKFANSITNH